MLAIAAVYTQFTSQCQGLVQAEAAAQLRQ